MKALSDRSDLRSSFARPSSRKLYGTRRQNIAGVRRTNKRRFLISFQIDCIKEQLIKAHNCKCATQTLTFLNDCYFKVLIIWRNAAISISRIKNQLLNEFFIQLYTNLFNYIRTIISLCYQYNFTRNFTISYSFFYFCGIKTIERHFS